MFRWILKDYTAAGCVGFFSVNPFSAKVVCAIPEDAISPLTSKNKQTSDSRDSFFTLSMGLTIYHRAFVDSSIGLNKYAFTAGFSVCKYCSECCSIFPCQGARALYRTLIEFTFISLTRMYILGVIDQDALAMRLAV